VTVCQYTSTRDILGLAVVVSLLSLMLFLGLI
jgi:hypothetical protein